MKIFKIITLLLVLTKVSVYAQQSNTLKRIPMSQIGKLRSNSHYYLYDDNQTKFVGTWIGLYNNEKVKIIFLKKGIRLNAKDDNEIEGLTGSLEYFENGKLLASYNENELLAGIPRNLSDTLNVFIEVKARKAQAALLAVYLPDGTIKLEIEKNRFEFKNDKNFEIKGPVILTKQN